jgi:predicted alpha/beta-hydrolase family hydrolase
MEERFEAADVRGFLHIPEASNGDGLVLTHGAGSDCKAPLLVAMARNLAAEGFLVLRCDLPFRQQRPNGPPFPATAARDREGIRNAASAIRSMVQRRLYLGGHSYGGRQATMLAAAEPGVAEGLLLLSYPLHPPRKPEQARTAHFPDLQVPSLFVHGTRDSFGSIEEMQAALSLIPGHVDLLPVEGAGHDLKAAPQFAAEIASRLSSLASGLYLHG